MRETLMITEPGFYPDMPIEEYHSDPCPKPSLNQSLAKVLLDKSPLHAWYQHPRLNPNYERNTDKQFDLGTAAHAMLIGRGKEIVPIPFDNWLTKAAKEAREEAALAGKQAVLQSQYERAAEMVATALLQLDARGLSGLFNSKLGAGELVMAWEESGVWLRQMVDWLTADELTFVDYKSTNLNSAPQNLGRIMHSAGWPIQAAMARRGLDVLSPDTTGRRHYLFILQETVPPHALQVCEMSEAVQTMGRKMLAVAVEIWERCMAENNWPAYPLQIQRPELPAWAENEWLAREIERET
jgi:hypothetical protein